MLAKDTAILKSVPNKKCVTVTRLHLIIRKPLPSSNPCDVMHFLFGTDFIVHHTLKIKITYQVCTNYEKNPFAMIMMDQTIRKPLCEKTKFISIG